MTSQSKAVIWVLAVFATGVLFGGAVSFFAVRPSSVPLPVEIAPHPDQAEPSPAPAVEQPLEPGEEARPFERPGASSGRPGQRRHNPMEEMRRLARYLELTPAQRGQVRQILQETAQRFQDANQGHRVRQRRIRSQMMRNLRTILTDEQKERFDEFIRSRMQHKRRPSQDRRRGNPPQRRQR